VFICLVGLTQAFELRKFSKGSGKPGTSSRIERGQAGKPKTSKDVAKTAGGWALWSAGPGKLVRTHSLLPAAFFACAPVTVLYMSVAESPHALRLRRAGLAASMFDSPGPGQGWAIRISPPATAQGPAIFGGRFSIADKPHSTGSADGSRLGRGGGVMMGDLDEADDREDWTDVSTFARPPDCPLGPGLPAPALIPGRPGTRA